MATVRIVGPRRQRRGIRDRRRRDHRDAPRPQRVLRQRRDVTAGDEDDRAAVLEHARVGLGDHLEPLHDEALCYPRASDALKTCRRSFQPPTTSRRACARSAGEIRRDHPDGVHLVCVLKGAFVFLSDLARAIAGLDGTGVTLDFMAVSSYGTSARSRRARCSCSRISTHRIEGRDVVIVEDIVDTGLTLTYLQEILRARTPRRLRTACLLSKPSRRKVDVNVEYIGFTIEDKFVVGYGLDYAERTGTCRTSASSATRAVDGGLRAIWIASSVCTWKRRKRP